MFSGRIFTVDTVKKRLLKSIISVSPVELNDQGATHVHFESPHL
jgi:hypothetical protein